MVVSTAVSPRPSFQNFSEGLRRPVSPPDEMSHLKHKNKQGVVVSPHIVLMVDLVRSLRGRDVEAVSISSVSRECSVVDKEFLATEENLRSARLIFSSPETLAYSKWRQALENPVVSSRVCAVIIDEAHCIQVVSFIIT